MHRSPTLSIGMTRTLVITTGAAMLLSSAPAAAVAAAEHCWVRNVTLMRTYGASSGSGLQRAIDEASPEDTLRVRGRCVGNFVIETDLSVVGVAETGFPTATLDGNASGSVLEIRSAVVTLTDLTITSGSSAGNGFGGAAIANDRGDLTINDSSLIENGAEDAAWENALLNLDGSVVLNGTSSVSDNAGGGIQNRRGTLILNDAASVSHNGNASAGHGIYNFFGDVTLNDSASVTHNFAGAIGGGIYSDGTLTLNDSSSVSGNTVGLRGDRLGGGIYNGGSLTLNDSSTVTGNAARNGGGIANYGSLVMRGTSSVRGNAAIRNGGGVFNFFTGTVSTRGSSSIEDNKATERSGGGLFNAGGVVELRSASSVSGNTAAHIGGGIFNTTDRTENSDAPGRITLRGSASVTANTAAVRGGGIYVHGAHGVLSACESWIGTILPNSPDDPPTVRRLPC
jgi:predicted outer membrane repeat protein